MIPSHKIMRENRVTCPARWLSLIGNTSLFTLLIITETISPLPVNSDCNKVQYLPWACYFPGVSPTWTKAIYPSSASPCSESLKFLHFEENWLLYQRTKGGNLQRIKALYSYKLKQLPLLGFKKIQTTTKTATNSTSWAKNSQLNTLFIRKIMFQNELHFKDHRHRQHPIAGASSHSPANGTSVVSTTVFKQLMWSWPLQILSLSLYMSSWEHFNSNSFISFQKWKSKI